METTVLVTGFEPFGGEKVNPALEAVKCLNGRVFTDASGSIRVVAAELATVFGESLVQLQSAIETAAPDVVLCVGQAGGRHHITLERVAINVDDARIPDNVGNCPVDTPVVAGGPVAYWATIPMKAMVKALQDAGIPASVSNSAGTYVCNHVFYGLMHLLETRYAGVRGGFIHIPFLPEQVVNRELPSMSLDDVIRGLETCVLVAARRQVDMQMSAGKES